MFLKEELKVVSNRLDKTYVVNIINKYIKKDIKKLFIDIEYKSNHVYLNKKDWEEISKLISNDKLTCLSKQTLEKLVKLVEKKINKQSNRDKKIKLFEKLNFLKDILNDFYKESYSGLYMYKENLLVFVKEDNKFIDKQPPLIQSLIKSLPNDIPNPFIEAVIIHELGHAILDKNSVKTKQVVSEMIGFFLFFWVLYINDIKPVSYYKKAYLDETNLKKKEVKKKRFEWILYQEKEDYFKKLLKKPYFLQIKEPKVLEYYKVISRWSKTYKEKGMQERNYDGIT